MTWAALVTFPLDIDGYSGLIGLLVTWRITQRRVYGNQRFIGLDIRELVRLEAFIVCQATETGAYQLAVLSTQYELGGGDLESDPAGWQRAVRQEQEFLEQSQVFRS